MSIPESKILVPCKSFRQALAIIDSDSKSERRAEGRETMAPIISLPPIPPSTLTVAKSVFAPGRTYRFRLTRTAIIASSGAGLMQLATSIAPSGMAEYSAVNALFLECRLRSTRIQYCFRSAGGDIKLVGFVSSFDPSNYSVAPTFQYACQQPGAKLMSLFQTSSSPAPHNEWAPRGVLRPWSTVAATPGGTDPMGGLVGTWYHSIDTATTASSNVATYLIECDYEFRNPL
jgi:hypothetical protein